MNMIYNTKQTLMFQLEKLASTPASEHVFTVENYQALQTISDKVSSFTHSNCIYIFFWSYISYIWTYRRDFHWIPSVSHDKETNCVLESHHWLNPEIFSSPQVHDYSESEKQNFRLFLMAFVNCIKHFNFVKKLVVIS